MFSLGLCFFVKIKIFQEHFPFSVTLEPCFCQAGLKVLQLTFQILSHAVEVLSLAWGSRTARTHRSTVKTASGK